MSDFDTNLDAKVVSTIEETDKKCPRCGGVMDYDPATGGLKCPYCDYEQEIKKEEEAPASAQELDFSEAENTANCNWGVEKKTVLCKACGHCNAICGCRTPGLQNSIHHLSAYASALLQSKILFPFRARNPANEL